MSKYRPKRKPNQYPKWLLIRFDGDLKAIDEWLAKVDSLYSPERYFAHRDARRSDKIKSRNLLEEAQFTGGYSTSKNIWLKPYLKKPKLKDKRVWTLKCQTCSRVYESFKSRKGYCSEACKQRAKRQRAKWKAFVMQMRGWDDANSLMLGTLDWLKIWTPGIYESLERVVITSSADAAIQMYLSLCEMIHLLDQNSDQLSPVDDIIKLQELIIGREISPQMPDLPR